MAEYILNWQHAVNQGPRSYVSHFCGDKVASEKGWVATTKYFKYFKHSSSFAPGVISRHSLVQMESKSSTRVGNLVNGITDKGVEALYNEARDCTMIGANTAAVLLARKLLMNVAVQHGAKPGETFVDYVDYLSSNGFVPPNGRAWVDQIRKKANEATHEIPQITQQDAQQIMIFVEMLLKFVYEFPSIG